MFPVLAAEYTACFTPAFGNGPSEFVIVSALTAGMGRRCTNVETDPPPPMRYNPGIYSPFFAFAVHGMTSPTPSTTITTVQKPADECDKSPSTLSPATP